MRAIAPATAPGSEISVSPRGSTTAETAPDAWAAISRPSWPPPPRTRHNVISAANAEALAAVNVRADALPPVSVVQIPLDGLAQSGPERLLWDPAQLTANLARIDGVALV